MSDLIRLVQDYTIKQDRVIKKICAPLVDFIDIPFFGYFRIEADGRFGNITNFPEELDFYYREKFYCDNPYLVHPSLLEQGCVFTTIMFNEAATEKLIKQFQMCHVLIILQRKGNAIDGFAFAPKGIESNTSMDYYAKLELMYKFIVYFKIEAKHLINNMMQDGFNLKDAKGSAFFHSDLSLPLLKKDPKALKFSKIIFPLSSKELECLNLFKQGHSAQSTAAILGLSQRTVEHYFDTIKNKLGCSSKWELLEW